MRHASRRRAVQCGAPMLSYGYAIPRPSPVLGCRPRRPRDARPIDHPDLHRGGGILDRDQVPDGHGHAHRRGCPGVSAGRLVCPVRRPGSGATAAVGAGELVFAALVSGGAAGSVTPGSSLGVPYTPRAQTSNASAYEEDITSSAAGGQHGTATLASSTDWYAVCAVFHPRPATASPQPSAPTGLEATSVASTRVALSWSPSSGGVAGYTVYRDGSPIGTTRPDTTTFMDEDVTGFTTYTYSVDAFDLA